MTVRYPHNINCSFNAPFSISILLILSWESAYKQITIYRHFRIEAMAKSMLTASFAGWRGVGSTGQVLWRLGPPAAQANDKLLPAKQTADCYWLPHSLKPLQHHLKGRHGTTEGLHCCNYCYRGAKMLQLPERDYTATDNRNGLLHKNCHNRQWLQIRDALYCRKSYRYRLQDTERSALKNGNSPTESDFKMKIDSKALLDKEQ